MTTPIVKQIALTTPILKQMALNDYPNHEANGADHANRETSVAMTTPIVRETNGANITNSIVKKLC